MLVATNKEIILIPHWVQDVLARQQINLAECLNFEKLKGILSFNDLTGFYVLQQSAEKVLGCYVMSKSTLYSHWYDSATPDSRAGILGQLDSGMYDALLSQEVDQRLFAAQSKDPRFTTAFTTLDLTPNVVGVALSPGYFSQPVQKNLQYDLIESILEVLYVYQPHYEVSKTPLNRKYLELLSERQLLVR